MVTEDEIKNMTPEEQIAYQKQQCIFCQIISGKVPSKSAYEDEKCIAIFDINPANPGHILLMPKEHYHILPIVPDELLKHLFVITKKISNALLKSLQCGGTNITVSTGAAAGQKAPHVLINIIPRFKDDGINFMLPKHKTDENQLNQLADIMRKNVNSVLGLKSETKNNPAQSKEDVNDKPVSAEQKKDMREKEEQKKEPIKEKGLAEILGKTTEKKGIDLDKISNLF